MAHIGVFDSGVGGLTVLKELAKLHSRHHFTYFGDTARCPYGGKSQDTIVRYAKEISHFLMTTQVDCIVIACNTATALALEAVQNNFSVPVFGVIEPAAKEACAVSQTGRIGVIGTRATITSNAYQAALRNYREGLSIFTQACPLFVPLVEELYQTPSIIRAIVDEYLLPIKQDRVDTLLLGCTHYPLLKQYIVECMGNEVAIVDPAVALAKEISNLQLTLTQDQDPRFRFCVSDDPQRFLRAGEVFFGLTLQHVDTVTL